MHKTQRSRAQPAQTHNYALYTAAVAEAGRRSSRWRAVADGATGGVLRAATGGRADWAGVAAMPQPEVVVGCRGSAATVIMIVAFKFALFLIYIVDLTAMRPTSPTTT